MYIHNEYALKKTRRFLDDSCKDTRVRVPKGINGEHSLIFTIIVLASCMMRIKDRKKSTLQKLLITTGSN